MSRIIIVSNRLPISVSATNDSFTIQATTGGLATALKSVAEAAQGNMIWIGWPGCFPKKTAVKPLTQMLVEKGIAPVLPDRRSFDGFYQHYSNEILWPVCHYLIERVPLVPMGYREYQKVNRMFAEKVLEVYQAGDKVWVHDYQLMLLPQLIRDELSHADIGYFHHIPFPSYEVFRTVPECRDLLKGLLGADLIGFHTASYVRHFRSAVSSLLGVKAGGDGFVLADRTVTVGAFPISIDFKFFDEGKKSDSCSQKIQGLKDATPGMKIFLAVDRLDYTKGVLRRLNAFEEMLKAHPDVLRRIVLVQVAVQTRSHVKEYARFKKQVDECVGRINGEFGDVDYQPVHYIAHGLPQEDLASLYKIADVMLVTPIRDGMNLVAKEYVAATSDEDGVLILSEFAGAAEEMIEAVQVNPYDVTATATAMYKAYIMDEGERRLRMHSLRERLRGWQNIDWANDFLTSLVTRPILSNDIQSEIFIGDKDLDAIAECCTTEEQVVLLLDYDGTLVPIESTPDRARPDPLLLDQLQQLSELSEVEVHIVSGRRREDLEAWFSDLPIYLHAEHGIWKRSPHEIEWKCVVDDTHSIRNILLPIARVVTENLAGAFIEDKAFGFAWHYRLSDPELAQRAKEKLIKDVEARLPGGRVTIIPGKEVLEFQPADVSKGTVARRIRAERSRHMVVAIGDDISDEDMFSELNGKRITMHVGSGFTSAEICLRGVESVRRFLSKFFSFRRNWMKVEKDSGGLGVWSSASLETVTIQH